MKSDKQAAQHRRDRSLPDGNCDGGNQAVPPHNTMHKNATDPLPALKFAIAIERAAMAATPEARPSRISMMFKRIGDCQDPQHRQRNRDPYRQVAQLDIRPRFLSVPSAARVCPRSFCAGVRTPKSSINPTIRAIVPDSSRTQRLRTEIREDADGEKEAEIDC